MAEQARAVTESLLGAFGLRDRELVSFVGAGGKSTLLLRLGEEIAAAGNRLVLTTTTKMGVDQIPEGARVINSPEESGGHLDFMLGEIDHPKVIGVAPALVDQLFESRRVDYVLVEADGARRRAIKAPASHEPVIPSLSTTVVIVTGLEAVGGVLGEVAHRTELVGAITGLGPEEKLTAKDVAEVITSLHGGLARIRDRARVVVALTYTGQAGEGTASSLRESLLGHPRLDRVLTLGLGT